MYRHPARYLVALLCLFLGCSCTSAPTPSDRQAQSAPPTAASQNLEREDPDGLEEFEEEEEWEEEEAFPPAAGNLRKEKVKTSSGQEYNFETSLKPYQGAPLPAQPARPTRPSAPASPTSKRPTQPAAPASSVAMAPYQSPNLSMQIPRGWKVQEGGVGIFHGLRVFDPQEPLNQLFFVLKAEAFLHDPRFKQMAAQLGSYSPQYALMAKYPVLENPSTANLFRVWPQFASLIQNNEPLYASINIPHFSNFKVLQTFPSQSPMRQYAIKDQLLHASFQERGRRGEGFFSASVVDFGQIPGGGVDLGYYMAYNVLAITSTPTQLAHWREPLLRSFTSIQYTPQFMAQVQEGNDQRLRQANYISATSNQIAQGLMDSWDKRSMGQEIASQKQSDATLGYDRVYDTDTEEVYRVPTGWNDNRGDSRYQTVTDDKMYLEPAKDLLDN